ERFYFVHSYGVLDWELEVTSPHIAAPLVTYAVHGQPFVAAVENGPLSATQFHPEKSGDAGARVRANWVRPLWRPPQRPPLPAPGRGRPEPPHPTRKARSAKAMSSTLELLPAVDVAGGQAVQLVQGKAGSGGRYGDPLQAALAWQND